MTYASWEPRYRATTVTPGKLDLFVVTFVNGRRTRIESILEYDDEVARAREFVRDHKCQIKVLPMTGPEFRNLLGITLPEHSKPMDAALRQLTVDTAMRVARESSDPDARCDALELLTDIGAFRP